MTKNENTIDTSVKAPVKAPVKDTTISDDKALALIRSFEDGDLINPEMEIIEGVEQLTTPVIRFEKDGQVIIGLYSGKKECLSSKQGPSDYFYFHTLITAKNIEIGFCGSKALDDALLKKQAYRYVVFIKYLKDKSVKAGKFKEFQIVAVDMENPKNPLYRIPDHPFVKIYKERKPLNVNSDRGGNEGGDTPY